MSDPNQSRREASVDANQSRREAAVESDRVDLAAAVESGRVDKTIADAIVRMQGQLAAIRRSNYVLYAAVILAGAIGLWRVTVLTHANKRTAQAANRSAQQAHTLAGETRQLLVQGRQARLRTQFQVCKETDLLASKLRVILISSAEGTKPFDRQLTALGFPPFKARLAAAQRQAASLTLTDCASLKPAGG